MQDAGCGLTAPRGSAKCARVRGSGKFGVEDGGCALRPAAPKVRRTGSAPCSARPSDVFWVPRARVAGTAPTARPLGRAHGAAGQQAAQCQCLYQCRRAPTEQPREPCLALRETSHALLRFGAPAPAPVLGCDCLAGVPSPCPRRPAPAAPACAMAAVRVAQYLLLLLLVARPCLGQYQPQPEEAEEELPVPDTMHIGTHAGA